MRINIVLFFPLQKQIQLWRHPDQIDRHVDVWISPKSISEFNKLTGAINMTYEVLTKNIYDQWDKKYSMNNIEDFNKVYQKYDEVNYQLLISSKLL